MAHVFVSRRPSPEAMVRTPCACTGATSFGTNRAWNVGRMRSTAAWATGLFAALGSVAAQCPLCGRCGCCRRCARLRRLVRTAQTWHQARTRLSCQALHAWPVACATSNRGAASRPEEAHRSRPFPTDHSGWMGATGRVTMPVMTVLRGVRRDNIRDATSNFCCMTCRILVASR
jgi:hypothetical protein